MDHHDPHPDDPETIDRNWSELLQELRVTQTGGQVLAGFLLTVPFSSGFPDLTETQRTAYLVVLSGAILSVALNVSPVAFHRILFRRRQRRWLVEAANVCALAALTTLGLTTCGIGFLIADVVAGRTAGLIALGVGLVVFAGLWGALPMVARARNGTGR